MRNFTVTWTRFSNFFDAWRDHEWTRKLLYVIGERHHCYIGSIGSRGGRGGFHTRYQWQYVNRACAIFGLNEMKGQVCFVGLPRSKRITGSDLHAIEANIQHRFIDEFGKKAALFEPISSVPPLVLRHLGKVPSFLR
jgi:hypothetical protein